MSDWMGFPEDSLRELLPRFPELKEYLQPWDLPTVHRGRTTGGYPARLVLVGSKPWQTITAALQAQIDAAPRIDLPERIRDWR
jgi:hypothetical protein